MPKVTNENVTKTKVNTEEESNDLLKKIEELQKTIDYLMKVNSDKSVIEIAPEVSDEGTVEEVPANKVIKIVSLFYGELNIFNGIPSQVLTFNNYGEVKQMPYHKLQDYLNDSVTSKFMNKGYFYILNKNVVSQYGLEDLYKTILPKEVINNIVNYSKVDIADLLKNAPEEQQENICRLLAQKVFEGEISDLEKIEAISKICNIDIYEMVRQKRKSLELENEE